MLATGLEIQDSKFEIAHPVNSQLGPIAFSIESRNPASGILGFVIP